MAYEHVQRGVLFAERARKVAHERVELVGGVDARFDEALEFEEPIYRSLSDVSWQPANDELYFDSDEPVYRSFGGFGSSTGAVENVDEGLPGSHEAWMRSMPPLVQRQSACSRL